MRAHPEAEQAYALHTAHKQGDWRKRIYVGLAENVDEVLDLVDASAARHYSVIASCVDGTPTLRLNERHQTQRIGLALLEQREVLALVAAINARGIERRDRFNSLTGDTLAESRLHKIIRTVRPWFDRWRRWRYRYTWQNVLKRREP